MNKGIIYHLFSVLLIGITLSGCKKGSDAQSDAPVVATSRIPPGNNLLYTYSDSYYPGFANSYGIYTNSDTGGTQTPLIESKSIAFRYPNWSNNDKIYFLSKYQGETKEQIYSINFDGTNVQRISKDTLTRYSTLDFSHITERFLYNKNLGSGLTELCSNNLQMTDEKVLLSQSTIYTRGHDGLGSWSPDGKTVVYSNSERNSNGQYIMNLYLMNADGTGQRNLTANTNFDTTYSTPFISPDGSKIVYTSSRKRLFGSYYYGVTDVYTCNIDGSNEVRITNCAPQTEFWNNANWARDSKRVLLIYYGIRIPYTLYIFNTADNTRKLATATWIKLDADFKQF